MLYPTTTEPSVEKCGSGVEDMELVLTYRKEEIQLLRLISPVHPKV